jgi:hypothetical protein
MGHRSIQVTVDIYGYLVPGGNRAAVDRLDDQSLHVTAQASPDAVTDDVVNNVMCCRINVSRVRVEATTSRL